MSRFSIRQGANVWGASVLGASNQWANVRGGANVGGGQISGRGANDLDPI